MNPSITRPRCYRNLHQVQYFFFVQVFLDFTHLKLQEEHKEFTKCFVSRKKENNGFWTKEHGSCSCSKSLIPLSESRIKYCMGLDFDMKCFQRFRRRFSGNFDLEVLIWINRIDLEQIVYFVCKMKYSYNITYNKIKINFLKYVLVF